ncbi:hypothetical protein K443DRAFT_330112 [Laccaria amethystina LaAM-08-1]|jgi:hypothetical protein|uniref:Uncharacterized protein n=1 Tax=Laccaria amethystina LaAM-08-1 TaxID=1095629 RepID=A0A0C9X2B1_9AGAR|nr:hypothetical protein K443DRAFT_330112 [Laccaria amethystina LaAM-08-1]
MNGRYVFYEVCCTLLLDDTSLRLENIDQVTSEVVFRPSELFSELSFVTQYKILSAITAREVTYRSSMNVNSLTEANFQKEIFQLSLMFSSWSHRLHTRPLQVIAPIQKYRS